MRLALSAGPGTLTLTFAGATLARKWTVAWDAAAAAATARALVGVLARGNQARALSDANLDDLRHHGEALWRWLPAELQRELGRGDVLTLELDEALVALPWELAFDGADFLCRRLSLGRVVSTGQARRGDERRGVGTPARVLVLAADPRADLPEVRAEGEAIVDALEANAAVRTRLQTAPDRAFVLRHLKDYDVVHFAGHADWVAERPGLSGWLLADGKLSADEIAAQAGGRPMPMIVVGNACRSGQTTAWSGGSDEVLGLANAFLTAGVRHYIGTQWEVVDGQSARFASAFYRELADGKAIGAAVRLARAAVVAEAGEQALAWASYVLYGDPEARPLWRAEARRKLSLPSVAKIAARASAPWKRPAVTRSGPPAATGAAAARRGWARWLPAALSGAAVGAFGVALVAYLVTRKPPPMLRPALSGVAVLALGSSATAEDQQRARAFEWCLPDELARLHVVVVPPEKLMTLQVQTSGALDRASARQLGLAVGARWVVFGTVASGRGQLAVSHVVDDLELYRDNLALDDVKAACARFAAAVAARLRAEPPAP
jgi:CHAT domain-containing protein